MENAEKVKEISMSATKHVECWKQKSLWCASVDWIESCQNVALNWKLSKCGVVKKRNLSSICSFVRDHFSVSNVDS